MFTRTALPQTEEQAAAFADVRICMKLAPDRKNQFDHREAEVCTLLQTRKITFSER
jgi:hypothetical protein